MFNFSGLYTNWGDGSQAEKMAHAAFANYMCRHAITGEVNTIKANLNLVAANLRTIAQTVFDRYLLLQDAYGYQVYITPKDGWNETWPAIFQGPYAGPMSTTTLMPGQTFTQIKTWAELIYADVAAQIPDLPTSKVFLSGMGVGGAIAILIAQKLSTTNRGFFRVVTQGVPKFMDQVMHDAQSVGMRNVKLGIDVFADLPPAMIYNARFYGAGVQLPVEVMRPSMIEIEFPDPHGQEYANAVETIAATGQNRFSWPDALTNAITPTRPNGLYYANSFNDVGSYVQKEWDELRRPLKFVIDEWAAFFNATYGFNLYRPQY